MPRSDHNGMIDGFMSVQAVRRSSDAKQPTRHNPEANAPPRADGKPPGSAQTPQRPKAHFGQTALPTRHPLICYACQYSFVVTGRLDKVICPKCKTQLETGDHHLDGHWSGTLKTVGNVFINSGAVVSSAHIVATDICIAGICRNARLEPVRHLLLDTGAQIEIDKLNPRHVIIIEGARLELDEPLRCQSLEIHGELQAEVRLQDRAILHTGSRFRGSLHAAKLVVHDGAGLSAKLHIEPQAPSPPPSAAAGDASQASAHKSSPVLPPHFRYPAPASSAR